MTIGRYLGCSRNKGPRGELAVPDTIPATDIKRTLKPHLFASLEEALEEDMIDGSDLDSKEQELFAHDTVLYRHDISPTTRSFHHGLACDVRSIPLPRTFRVSQTSRLQFLIVSPVSSHQKERRCFTIAGTALGFKIDLSLSYHLPDHPFTGA